MKKPIPKFKNQAAEFEFWSSTGPGADSTEYLDWPRASRVKLPDLKPTQHDVDAPSVSRDRGNENSGY